MRVEQATQLEADNLTRKLAIFWLHRVDGQRSIRELPQSSAHPNSLDFIGGAVFVVSYKGKSATLECHNREVSGKVLHVGEKPVFQCVTAHVGQSVKESKEDYAKNVEQGKCLINYK